MNVSPLLGKEEHQLFQSLIGQLPWMTIICCFTFIQTIPSLNKFCCSCPRSSRHLLDMAILVTGYIKQFPAVPCIPVNSRPFLVINRLLDKNSTEKYKPDFLMDWPDAKEELDLHWCPKSSSVTANELPITIFIDSDDAHDSKTRHSTTGFITFVGSTLVNRFPKRQGAIASSTYQAEFSVLRSATEEAIHLCYMLRSVVNPHAINIIQKPGVAFSFHTARKYAGVHLRRIHECYWINGSSNTADICTKQTPAKIHNDHSDYIFYRENFSFHDKNRL